MSILGLGLPRPYQRAISCTLLILCVLIAVPAEVGILVGAANTSCVTSPPCGQVDISPGKFDLKLGADFPNFTSVKLSYPNSSILTNSTGDLLFNVTLISKNSNLNITDPSGKILNATRYNAIDIYIPPDFTGLAIDKVWTSFTNDYDPNRLSVSRVGSTDQIAPGWWRVSVKNIILTNDPSATSKSGPLTPRHIFVANQSQYIRLFQVNSPTIAGRYFFKVFLNSTSVGARNFPTLVVKGSRDPAYVSGTLRDSGNLNSTLAGKPINLTQGYGARIVATGIDYLGKTATAQTFINYTAQGQYTLFGVAPGTYNITAYAAGFLPTTRPTTISVYAGQSLEGADILLPHSVTITGTVFSVDATGNATKWDALYDLNGRASNRSISIRVLTLDGTQIASTPAPFRAVLFTDGNATTFPFTIHREVGYDGRIPQDYANYTSGIPPGDYYLRAAVTSYVQFENVIIHVNDQTDDAYSTIRLVRSGFFVVTVHFRNSVSSLVENNTGVGATLSVSAYDLQWNLVGSNTTQVFPENASATLEIIGSSTLRTFGNVAQLPLNAGLPPGTYHIVAHLTSSPLFTGYSNIGVRDIYFQLDNVMGTIGFPTPVSAPTFISFSMFRGGRLILNLFSVDAETPPVLRPWMFPGAPIQFKIRDQLGNVFTVNSTQVMGQRDRNITYIGLLPSDYSILIETFGYNQAIIPHIPILLGDNSDLRVQLVQGPVIDLTLTFKTEGIFLPINSTQPYAQPLNHLDATPVRIEVYDALGNFVAANATYIPNLTNLTNINPVGERVPTTTARFLLAGFKSYFGDPKNTWAGFYDTTDASRQDEGGLVPGDYQILVWLDGYYQPEQIQVHLGPRQNASLVVSMERASRISGIIAGPDLYYEARPLSWATITLQPFDGNLTTLSLDGYYQVWAPAGTYNIGVGLPGYSTQTASLSIPAGSDIRQDFWLPDYGPTQFPRSQLAPYQSTKNQFNNYDAANSVPILFVHKVQQHFATKVSPQILRE